MWGGLIGAMPSPLNNINQGSVFVMETRECFHFVQCFEISGSMEEESVYGTKISHLIMESMEK